MQAVIKNASHRPCRIFMQRPPVNRGSIAPGVLQVSSPQTDRRGWGALAKWSKCNMQTPSLTWRYYGMCGFLPYPWGLDHFPSHSTYWHRHTHTCFFIFLSHTHTLYRSSRSSMQRMCNTAYFQNQLACGLTERLGRPRIKLVWVHLTPIRHAFQRDLYVRHVLVFKSA